MKSKVGDIVILMRPGQSWTGGFAHKIFKPYHTNIEEMVLDYHGWQNMKGAMAKVIDIRKHTNGGTFYLVKLLSFPYPTFSSSHMVVNEEAFEVCATYFLEPELFTLE